MHALVALLALVAQPDVVIAHTNVVDVEHGSVMRDVDVVVHNGRITRIGQQGMRHAGPAAEVVDGAGKYVIPGLWDMHVHWYHEPTLNLFTANGVTGVRIMYGSPMHLAWKKRVEAGELVGPHMVVGSPIVDGPNPVWPGSIKVANAEEGRAAVAKIQADGYEFVKVYARLPRDAYFAIIDESKKRKIPVEGHVPNSVEVMEATKAGQKSIEHLDKMVVTLSSKAKELNAEVLAATEQTRRSIMARTRVEAARSQSPELTQKMNEAFIRNRTWHCPTMVVNRTIGHLLDADIDKDPRMRYFPAAITKSWDPRNDFRFKSQSPEDFANMRIVFDAQERILGDMARAGVRLLAGTDTGNPYCFPGFSLHDELRLMVDSGLTPLQALQTATLNPARFLGRKDMGTVQVGKQGDLVILDANPLENIQNTTKIRAVTQGGRLFRRSDLDEMLVAAERSAKG